MSSPVGVEPVLAILARILGCARRAIGIIVRKKFGHNNFYLNLGTKYGWLQYMEVNRRQCAASCDHEDCRSSSLSSTLFAMSRK